MEGFASGVVVVESSSVSLVPRGVPSSDSAGGAWAKAMCIQVLAVPMQGLIGARRPAELSGLHVEKSHRLEKNGQADQEVSRAGRAGRATSARRPNGCTF